MASTLYCVVTNAKEGGTTVITDSRKHNMSNNPLVPNGNNEKQSLELFDIALVPAAGEETETFWT